jgi:hypothetical protein
MKRKLELFMKNIESLAIRHKILVSALHLTLNKMAISIINQLLF